MRKTQIGGGECSLILQSTRSGPILPNDVLLKPKFCGICGSDLHTYRWQKGTICPGHEITAIVQQVGCSVTSVIPGDCVVVEPLKVCGSCDACKAGKRPSCNDLGIFGVHQDGGFSDELIVPDYTLFKLPSTVDLQMGTLTEPLAVAVHTFRALGYDLGKESTDKIVVLGCGTIGLMMLVVAPYFGFKSISITAKYPNQIEVAQKICKVVGLEVAVYDPNLTGLMKAPDVIIETVGRIASTVADAIKHIKKGGKIAIVGVFEPGKIIIDPYVVLIKGLTIIGSNVYDHTSSPPDFGVSLQILQEHGESLKGLLMTHVFSLDDIPKAFAIADKKESGAVKVVIQI